MSRGLDCVGRGNRENQTEEAASHATKQAVTIAEQRARRTHHLDRPNFRGDNLQPASHEYSGKVSFGKLNVDENPVASNAFQIQSIPALLVFKKGKLVDGIIGAVPKHMIESKIKLHLNN